MSACQGISLNPASDQLCRSGVSPPEGGSIAALRLLVWRAKIFFLKTGFCGIIIQTLRIFIIKLSNRAAASIFGPLLFFFEERRKHRTVKNFFQRKVKPSRSVLLGSEKWISGTAPKLLRMIDTQGESIYPGAQMGSCC